MTTLPHLYFFLRAFFFVAAAVAVTTPPKSPLRLTLHHKYNLASNQSEEDYHNYVHKKIRVDSRRRQWIEEKLAAARNKSSSRQELLNDFTLPLGSPFKDGDYLIRADMGTQKSPQLFVIDTVTENPWLQCQPCSHCYNQYALIYDPTRSNDSKNLLIDDLVCIEIRGRIEGPRRECLFDFNSHGVDTRGQYTLQRISWSDGQGFELFSEKIPIGCANDNKGSAKFSGVLSLSLAPLSLVKTLYLESFSYCLVSPGDRKRTSFLIFNDTTPPLLPNTVYLDLMQSFFNDFIYVNLTEIVIGGQVVTIPPAVRDIHPGEEIGGVYLDSGTMLMYLARLAYYPVEEAFTQQLTTYQRAGPPPRGKDTPDFKICFNVTGGIKIPYPGITLNFQGQKGAKAELQLRLNSYILNFGNTECFSILQAKTDISIIGNFQQYGIQFYFDFVGGRISMTPSRC